MAGVAQTDYNHSWYTFAVRYFSITTLGLESALQRWVLSRFRNLDVTALSLLNARQAVDSARTNILTTLPNALGGLRDLAQWVREARAEKLAFRQSVHDHERAHSNPPSHPPLLPSMGRGGGRSGRRSGGRSSSSTGMTPSSSSDLRVRPPTSKNVPTSVPRNIASQVVWDVLKFDIVATVPTSGILEANDNFSLSNHPQASSWTTLFDQYCIPQASITYQSLYPSGSTFAPATMYTALDFDSNGTLGSVAAIEDFTTCAVKTMGTNQRVVRSIRPCNEVSTGSSISDLSRNWHDSTVPNIPHNGIRFIVGSAATSYNIRKTVTVWYAFRNQI